MRLKDLQLTVELLTEVTTQEKGARERVAIKYGITKSVITDRVKRIEVFFDMPLFTGPQRKTPTAAGVMMVKYGPQIIDEIETFSEMLRNAEEWSL